MSDGACNTRFRYGMTDTFTFGPSGSGNFTMKWYQQRPVAIRQKCIPFIRIQELPRDSVHHYQGSLSFPLPIPPRHVRLSGSVPCAVAFRRHWHPHIRQSHPHGLVLVLQRPHHPHIRYHHQQLPRSHNRSDGCLSSHCNSAIARTSRCCRRHVRRLPPPRAQVTQISLNASSRCPPGHYPPFLLLV
jgi:hypothetical protein